MMLYMIAGASSVLMYTVLVGLGVHRYNDPVVVCLGSTIFVLTTPAHRVQRQTTGTYMLHTSYIWSLALFLLMLVYFPNERSQALQTGSPRGH